MPLLEVRALRLGFDGRTVLDGLDFTVEAGEIHALLGTNGTGKTTLAYAVMGCEGYAPDAGDIVFDGRVINGLPIHERARLGIALTWQEPARFEGISGLTKTRAALAEEATAEVVNVTDGAAEGARGHLETLMAHGLTPEEATDLIVRGILR